MSVVGDSKVDLDERCVSTIRCLAVDMVQEANSGHPGMPLGMAPAAHVLFSKFLRFSPEDPKWPNRDRFVLSNGHGCALLYSMLHLCGYEDLKDIESLKDFRQLDSKTPGHPESHETTGVEVSTGPLGQGFANAVGLAIAREHAAAKYNKPGHEIVNHRVYAFCGDGCLQEGVASEAASLAGHLKLKNLIIIYDDNQIQIDGNTNKTFTEDVPARFQAYGWKTITVEKRADGDTDQVALEAAITEAIDNSDKPVLISLKTIIGFGAGAVEGSEKSHGAPLGASGVKTVKEKFAMVADDKFQVPGEVRNFYNEIVNRGNAARKEWQNGLESYATAHPSEASEFTRIFVKGELPDGWDAGFPEFKEGESPATRATSGKVLNAVAAKVPELIGGSADLTGSNKTALNGEHDFQADSYDGRYLRYGVREFAMAAIGNGLSAYGYIPFSATFLNFITYAWGAVRLGALSKQQHVYIMTHDSIFLGEDGPTHQPVEVLPLLRATPNVVTFRPADGKETIASYACALKRKDGPTVIALSRQGLPTLKHSDAVVAETKGAYTVSGNADVTPDLVLIASGSEVSVALKAAEELQTALSIQVRVVSCPSMDIFAEQSAEYRRETLPVGAPVVSIEASSHFGWAGFSHFHIGMTTFGASGKGNVLGDHFGFSQEKIVARCKDILEEAKELPIGALGCQRSKVMTLTN